MESANVQRNPQAITRQQEILKALGYAVEPTGSWDAATRKAMLSFEQTMQFLPARKNNGLPLPLGGPLPKGWTRDPNNMGLLWHPVLRTDTPTPTVTTRVAAEPPSKVVFKPSQQPQAKRHVPNASSEGNTTAIIPVADLTSSEPTTASTT
jgi:hypothetical protein